MSNCDYAHLHDKIESEREFITHLVQLRKESEGRLQFFKESAEKEQDVIDKVDRCIAIANSNINDYKELLLCNTKKNAVSATDC